MGTPLTNNTIERIDLLFQGAEDRQFVTKILIEQCGANLPFYEDATPEFCERIRYAVLKLSNGSLAEFQRAVKIANEDWRDSLVAAGFGSSVTIHESWWPGNQ